MDRIKKEIRRYIKSKYNVNPRRDKKGLSELIEDNNKVIDSFLDSIDENIEAFVNDNVDTIMNIIEDRCKHNPNKYIHAVEMAISDGVTDWDSVCDALLQYGPNKRAMARRKLKPGTGYHVDDIDIQRLRKIGVKV